MTACSNAAAGTWWHSSAMTSPYPAVSAGDVVAARQGLQGDDVDDPADLRPAAAELAWLDAEVLVDAGPPLVGQRFAVYQHEGRRCAWAAMTAQAITVLPDPGGATSTPRSWPGECVCSLALVAR